MTYFSKNDTLTTDDMISGERVAILAMFLIRKYFVAFKFSVDPGGQLSAALGTGSIGAKTLDKKSKHIIRLLELIIYHFQSIDPLGRCFL